MKKTTSTDYAMEYRLKEINPELHTRFSNAVFAIQHILSNYKLIFPDYTDHSELHSLTIIDFCNRIIGAQIDRMNGDEIYALLMGCYFHDTGMGISKRDFEEFTPQIDFGDYFDTHSNTEISTIIRDFHNEYAGCFIRKYADFFEIPSDDHLTAIVQIARGHRKTLLSDEKTYPVAMPVPGGNTICLPYLAALIRLADEIDVAASRDPAGLYDLDSLLFTRSGFEHRKLQAVEDLTITDSVFIMHADTKDEEVIEGLRRLAEKMQKTLDDCRAAVNGRTPFVITQEHIRLTFS